jgi:hypothetical protein
MPIKDRNYRATSNALWRVLAVIVSSLLTAGCAATTSNMLENVESVQVCLNGKCGPAAGRFTRDELVGGLLVMLKANENSEIVLCSSDEGFEKCESEGLRWYVQGGPIPGHASFEKPYLIQVGLDKQTSQIKFKVDATVKWIGTPVFCQDAYTELTVSSTDQIVVESKFACTWAIFPHGWNMKYSVGFIDFDNSIIAGNFAVSGGGLLTAGAGSGSFIMRFARKRTLLAETTGDRATEAVLIPVGQLPPQILAARAPARDDVKKSKGGPNLAERTLWESVSKENRADGYRQYLARYPEGRFASTARANLQAIEQREAQNSELALWSKIKDSTDPHDFESYIAQYPKGLFVDLASVRAQRFRTAAKEAAMIDAELALWDQVKGSTDVDEIRIYLKRYPSGQFAGIARNRIRKLTAASKEVHDLEMEMWNKVKSSRKIDDFQSFLEAFPNGIFSGIAKSRIENLIGLEAQTEEITFWNSIKDSANPNDFEEYLRRYPTGQYADHARRLSRHLASLKAEREELELWESIKDSKNPDDFDLYLAKYPEGRFTQVARDRRKAAARAKSMTDIDFGHYHALVIGNGDYRHFKDLATAINDAEAVASLLEQAYGFEVTCLTNASRKQIIDSLSRFRHTLTKGDNLLIYFAGHGWLDKAAGRGYWLPVDSDRDSPANWISTGDISDMLKAMAAKHVMVVADSCYSGTLTRSIKVSIPNSEYYRRMANKRTRVALSSGGLEPVLDDGGCGHSVFAKAFLEVLEKNAGVLEGTRLFNELRRPVILNAPQTPEYADILYAGHEGGDFFFVRK